MGVVATQIYQLLCVQSTVHSSCGFSLGEIGQFHKHQQLIL
uniref:Uncharacterized protein n=1 Tax=Arundo donax TaxID=35708 RepID=A0A0A9BBZ1_ARUDO